MSVPFPRLTPEQRALCLAARTEPAGNAADRLRRLIADRDFDWARLWALAHLHEVVPLVGDTLTTVGGELVPDDWRQRALLRRHVTLRANGHLADTLFDVLGGLQVAGIQAMPVKGLVIAERAYGDIAARPCADLDVLVRARDLPASRDVLRSLGFGQRALPGYKALVHAFHDPAWGRGAGPDHVRLELHWALWADSEQRLGTDGLWARSVVTRLMDQRVRTLSLEDTLLHLAIHRTRSALRLRWVVDVAEIVRRHGATVDWAMFIAHAREAQAATASWSVLSVARDLLDAPVPAEVLAELQVARAKRALLERTCGATALFRPAPAEDVGQQPHLALRAFEEDGPVRIARSLSGSAIRPVREALHDSGLRRVGRRAVSET